MNQPKAHMHLAFEAWHRIYFPGINVTRKGDGYSKQQVNNRWFVWQGAQGVTLPLPELRDNKKAP